MSLGARVWTLVSSSMRNEPHHHRLLGQPFCDADRCAFALLALTSPDNVAVSVWPVAVLPPKKELSNGISVKLYVS